MRIPSWELLVNMKGFRDVNQRWRAFVFLFLLYIFLFCITDSFIGTFALPLFKSSHSVEGIEPMAFSRPGAIW